MAKKLLIPLIIILCIVGAVWYKIANDNHVTYQTSPVERGSITKSVQATGTVNPLVSVTVGAQVSGKITKLFVDYNSPVKKGDLLALIDPATYQAAVGQAQAQVSGDTASLTVAGDNIQAAQASVRESRQNLQAQEAQLKKDRASAENARLYNQRMEYLVKKDLVARSDADSARYSYKSYQATLEQDQAKIIQAQEQLNGYQIKLKVAQGQYLTSQASLNKSRANLEQATTNLNYTKIVSPVDGVVISRSVDVGQTVVSSFQAPSLFVIAQDLSEMQIDAEVDEASISQIKDNQAVEFNVAAFPTETFKGKVSQIRINPVTEQNVVNYDVMIKVANPKFQLLPGMTATVNFILERRENILKITNQALKFIPPSNGKKKSRKNGSASPSPSSSAGGEALQIQKPGSDKDSHLWVLENGRPVRKTVQLGVTDGLETEVISGLSEGEEVITGSETKKGGSSSSSSSRNRMRMSIP